MVPNFNDTRGMVPNFNDTRAGAMQKLQYGVSLQFHTRRRRGQEACRILQWRGLAGLVWPVPGGCFRDFPAAYLDSLKDTLLLEYCVDIRETYLPSARYLPSAFTHFFCMAVVRCVKVSKNAEDLLGSFL
jgi:hypothetical protein